MKLSFQSLDLGDLFLQKDFWGFLEGCDFNTLVSVSFKFILSVLTQLR